MSYTAGQMQVPDQLNQNTEHDAPASARATHILVVDDDDRLRDLLRRYLTEQGFRVSQAARGQEALALKRQHGCDLMVLDIMMPIDDGFSVCRQLRASGDQVPIILLTAKNDDSTRIMGLDGGADDYLAKPFNPRELLARIRAVLRRTQVTELPGAPSPQPGVIAFGPYQLNLATRRLTREGAVVPMTTSEFAMLKVFVRHPNIPLSRDRLMELVRGREYAAFDRSLDVQISRLRKLLEPAPSKPIYIQTVWGVGYVFVPDAHS